MLKMVSNWKKIKLVERRISRPTFCDWNICKNKAAGLFSLCGDMKCWRSEDCKNSRTCHLSSLPLTPASTESNINSKTIFSFLFHNSPRKTAKEYPLNTTERRIYKQDWNTFNLCLPSVWRNLLRLRQSEYIQRRKGKDFTIYFPVLSFITFLLVPRRVSSEM